jgi:hypothetical protein
MKIEESNIVEKRLQSNNISCIRPFETKEAKADYRETF